MSLRKFIIARQEGRSVIYTTADGNEVRYSGGSWAWRNNNPGNLRPGKVSRRNGAIGKAGGFAVFPDIDTGRKALFDSLKNVHGSKDISALMNGYAPSFENDTANYIKFIRKKTGVRDSRKVKDFTAEEFEKLWRAIEQMEGWKEGKIELIPSDSYHGQKREITQVRKNKKGTIVAYKVEGIGWVSKVQGIDLASKGEIDAVVATSRAGNLFLRTRPSLEIVNLEDLG